LEDGALAFLPLLRFLELESVGAGMVFVIQQVVIVATFFLGRFGMRVFPWHGTNAQSG
jgi:hypothetical protein